MIGFSSVLDRILSASDLDGVKSLGTSKVLVTVLATDSENLIGYIYGLQT